jgi:hypothetical protein
LDTDLIQHLLEETGVEGVVLDTATLEFALRKNMERMAGELLEQPTKIQLLQRLDSAVELAASLPFQVNTWQVQNICYELLHSTFPHMQQKAEEDNGDASKWVERFVTLCQRLSVKISEP